MIYDNKRVPLEQQDKPPKALLVGLPWFLTLALCSAAAYAAGLGLFS